MPWLPALVPFDTFAARDVLEVGCGVGFDAYTFLLSGANYVGVDITPANIDRTLRHLAFFGLSPDVRVAAAERLPFASSSFDIVYSNGVLHHLAEPSLGIREAARVLRPNGDAWIVIYHRTSVFYWLNIVLARHVLSGGFLRSGSINDRLAAIEHTTSVERPVVHVFTKRQLARDIAESGLELISIDVRKLTRPDLPPLGPFSRVWYHIPQSWLDRIATRFGWYLIAHAKKTA